MHRLFFGRERHRVLGRTRPSFPVRGPAGDLTACGPRAVVGLMAHVGACPLQMYPKVAERREEGGGGGAVGLKGRVHMALGR